MSVPWDVVKKKPWQCDSPTTKTKSTFLRSLFFLRSLDSHWARSAEQCRTSPDTVPLQGASPFILISLHLKQKRAPLKSVIIARPFFFLFPYSPKKEEVLSVADKLNPIKIWRGAGAWLGTRLRLVSLPIRHRANQSASKPSRQARSQPPTQTASQTVNQPGNRPAVCSVHLPGR